jgi:hypothetical protein
MLQKYEGLKVYLCRAKSGLSFSMKNLNKGFYIKVLEKFEVGKWSIFRIFSYEFFICIQKFWSYVNVT